MTPEYKALLIERRTKFEVSLCETQSSINHLLNAKTELHRMFITKAENDLQLAHNAMREAEKTLVIAIYDIDKDLNNASL